MGVPELNKQIEDDIEFLLEKAKDIIHESKKSFLDSYNQAKAILTSDKAKYRLANLSAHSYYVVEMCSNGTAPSGGYVIMHHQQKPYDDIIILPDGKSFKRCIG